MNDTAQSCVGRDLVIRDTTPNTSLLSPVMNLSINWQNLKFFWKEPHKSIPQSSTKMGR